MHLSELRLPIRLYDILSNSIGELRPSQEKAVQSGLLEGASLLVCTPTASGKTLIAEIACLKSILESNGRAIYIVPLKALATEKFKDFSSRYGHIARIALAIGDVDSAEPRLADYDLIVCTAEKLDSLLRHKVSWVSLVSVVVVDEIHLLTDTSRGPTLEVLITMLRKLLPKLQIIGLSATIGNPLELSQWLDASLVEDSWRPVKLHQGVYVNGELEFY
ncbi:MAG: DEAD/DEAH box helicase [Candidatus Woesearchaeota archaeon]